MSQHQTHGSDRAAAYRGLILGAIVLGILLTTIVKLTRAHYAGAEGAKASAVQVRSTGGIDV
jgi:hypothetical protein